MTKSENKLSKHNKKRNTAILYEFLIRELTKNVVDNNVAGKNTVLSLCKEHFKKGTMLRKELDLFNALDETKGLNSDTARRLLDRIVEAHAQLDPQKIFGEQSSLLDDMNKRLPKTVFTNFVPEYKSLASIAQIFSKGTPPKSKVLLEQALIEKMIIDASIKKEPEMVAIDNLTYKTFVNNFNSVYGKSLLPEQKELVTQFVMSFSDNGTGLKIFLNEEIGRLRKVIEESLTLEEIAADTRMVSKTKAVLEKIDSYKTMPVDKVLVGEVMKIQMLVKEVQS